MNSMLITKMNIILSMQSIKHLLIYNIHKKQFLLLNWQAEADTCCLKFCYTETCI